MLNSNYRYVKVPVLEMRKEPSSKSEVVSQALFSERVHSFDEYEGWARIETEVDGYQGWVMGCGIHAAGSSLFEEITKVATVNRLSAHLYTVPDTIYGPLMTVPFESRLKIVKEAKDGRWITVSLPGSKEAYVQTGDVVVGKRLLDRAGMCRLSLSFLGLPYTWGGRSSFGYDCSGFVQMLYRQMGVALPRDSSQQFHSKLFVEAPIADLKAGDLAFFGTSKNAIKHVGLCLGEGKFIHTSAVTENKPYVRISSFHDDAWNGSGYYPCLAGRMYTEHVSKIGISSCAKIPGDR